MSPFVATPGSAGAADDAGEPDVAALSERVSAADDHSGVPGVSGEEAVEILAETDTTDLAAGNAGLETAELVEELREDPAVFVTKEAMVGYVDVADASALSGDSGSEAALAPEQCITPYELDSLPGAKRVLYLDFNGHVTVDQPWNISGFEVISSAKYTGGSSAICQIWRRVAEDFLPFNVNVTTRDPGVEGLRWTSAGDNYYGQRMVISPTNFVGSGTLGIALLDVFDSSEDFSAFVFTSGLSAWDIAEAVSHEAGHTFGLSHDGTTSQDYYVGHGDWAPIMGFPLDKKVTQWSEGEYDTANNTQDDIAIIGARTGYRKDETTGNAASAAVVGCDSITQGVIGANGDVDAFVVDVGAGALSVTLKPEETWGNLHAKLTVLNEGGTEVASDVPAAAAPWTASVSPNVAAGRYTIKINSIGWLDPATTGFSSYGSMGEYRLTVAGVAPTVSGCTARLTPIDPARVVDTRTGVGGSRRLGNGRTAVVQVAGKNGVPFGASAAVLNVVTVNPSNAGFVTTYPCDKARPTTAALTYTKGQVVANTGVVTLSASGQVCIYVMSATDIVVDVTGWLGAAGTSRFKPYGPKRVMDTRTGLGGSTRLSAGKKVRLDLSSRVPSSTTAVSLNIAVVNASAAGFVTAYPCDKGLPATATVNYVAGEVRPNNTIVGVDGGEDVCIYSLAPADIVVDLTGYFSPNGLSYLATSPDRLLDTRETVGYLGADRSAKFRAAAASVGAQAASVNIAATDHQSNGFVTNYDCDTRGNTATLNPIVGEVNSNGAIAPLGNGRDSCLYTLAGGNLVVDLNGWWVS